MVDALRRAHGFVRSGGCVIDLHPTPGPARVLVGDVMAGNVDAGDGPVRHQAASDAIDAAVAAGLFAVQRAFEFDFSAYADTIDELQEHILEDWCDARIGEDTMVRARTLLQKEPAQRPRVCERVRITRLQPSTPRG